MGIDASASLFADFFSPSCIGSGGKDQGEDGEDCQDDDLSDADGDADEDESDLDMAWKMLDIARVITDKQSTETMEKVDILCSLAEVSLERGIFSSFHLCIVLFSHVSYWLVLSSVVYYAEDIESSLSDYKNALSILERLVEPDSRRTAELNPCGFLNCT